MSAVVSHESFTVWRWLRWLDSDATYGTVQNLSAERKQTTWAGYLPFIIFHLGCLAVFFAGISPWAVGVAFALYWVRMFAVTAFYHRYLSHRTFKMSRWLQFAFALLTLTCVQRGPLWWASNHRHHHQVSDQPTDIHSPIQNGFWWSQMGWLTNTDNLATDYSRVKDLVKFPELVFLNRFDWIGSLLLIVLLAIGGQVVNALLPEAHTNGWQWFIWGYFVSTTVLFHATWSINSLAHLMGKQRYETGDKSRNSFLLAIITMGEGWHNNHHKYQSTVRQGFFWWEIDPTYYILKAMSWVGLVWDLKPIPKQAFDTENWVRS